ncbi:MAG TPA: NAD(P)/FAD-dependent oxidoreductase [Burkholderiales bacterium]|nr:NAD(P)/FAD-dependent oxidoreductase [Burkholderiales bacterium]
MTPGRRRVLRGLAATAGAAALGACASAQRRASGGRVVVIGGGYAGATAARYLRLWAPEVGVTLIERDRFFISCPMSNLVLGGNARIEELSVSYDGLRRHGVTVMRDEATAIDPQKRLVRTAGSATLAYDRLVVAPGVDFLDSLPALRHAAARQRVLHAWKAGAQTVALRRQLEAMRDGGVYVLHIPMAPYRCPPGPYERVCQVADYFKRVKPRSKIIVLDANPDITSKKALFLEWWNGPYRGMIDYRPNSELEDVDVANMTLKLVFEDVKGDVLNVIPPHTAGAIARRAGLITANERWCGIDWLTGESTAVKGIHVLGDSTLSAPAMPKSASMANQHGKLCAAAIAAVMKGEVEPRNPVMINTCYSMVDGRSGMHVTTVHKYDAREKTLLPVKGAGGISREATALEGTYAWGWARNIWADSLA